ncbi:EAL domain-containing protein [Cellulomonas cellasea]|uniref:EAL domain-containing protein (Putative c-di-GMP-specific phosphodiesterase class I) n=1 Tax=Cellulomonas cellasea TaxID=43670 RepID=A0A7W4YA51_9CELL|nr:EAL domain-containing protein [Cellulomonas cellasea]MBB2921397.1 EAL domain-containing protein (putative c-di-GMP-specific phosphodiesterase class I) [Cellulomonas cellasea]
MTAVVTRATDELDDPVWDDALDRVLAGEGVRLVAQPIIDVTHARVGGYELLSRFDGPPSASPDVWFAAARRRGVDALLTAIVLRSMHALRARGVVDGFCSINVEPHLMAEPVVRGALFERGRLDGVVVELTEHVAAHDDDALGDVLAEVRALGGLVAIDDAGTGHSGLTQLLRVRPDIVKLDRALITGVHADPVQRATVRMLGDLAGEMDAWLVAEGVETREELAALIHLGVPLVQGYALGRPASGWTGMDDDMTAFVRQTAASTDRGEHVVGLVRVAQVLPATMARHATGAAPGAVVLDARNRPASVVVRDPAGGTHLAPALVVTPSAAPLEVLRRATARAVIWRGAPVVCVEPSGIVLGTVDVGDLVEHLVQRVPAA